MLRIQLERMVLQCSQKALSEGASQAYWMKEIKLSCHCDSAPSQVASHQCQKVGVPEEAPPPG